MIRVETAAFDAILDFWRLPVGEGPPSLVLRQAASFHPGVSHSVVSLLGTTTDMLFRFDDGEYIYGSVVAMDHAPEGLVPLARLDAVNGSAQSFILEDPDRHIVYVPFSPDALARAFTEERYVAPARPGRKQALGAYYALKRVIPRSVLMAARGYVARRQLSRLSFPRWPLETSLDSLLRRMLALFLRASRLDSLPFVWFWPDGLSSCAVLTHDVEGVDGRDMIETFVELERSHGLVSSFNLVPSKYDIPPDVRRRVTEAGHEVGVHGWDHEGSLVSDRQLFDDRATRINKVADEWSAVGFRSPSTYRDAEWFQELEFEYDSSFPDTDPFEPQAGGCLSLFPYSMGSLIELPITMPQDHTQFALLARSGAEMWRDKARALKLRNAFICMLTHPDTAAGYTGSPQAFEVYDLLLGDIAVDQSLWKPLPREAARWWRERSRVSVDSMNAPVGPGSARGRARLGLATLRGDGELKLSLR